MSPADDVGLRYPGAGEAGVRRWVASAVVGMLGVAGAAGATSYRPSVRVWFVVDFPLDASAVPPEERLALDHVARVLEADPSIGQVILETHASKDDALARARVEAIEAYLERGGVAATRLARRVVPPERVPEDRPSATDGVLLDGAVDCDLAEWLERMDALVWERTAFGASDGVPAVVADPGLGSAWAAVDVAVRMARLATEAHPDAERRAPEPEPWPFDTPPPPPVEELGELEASCPPVPSVYAYVDDGLTPTPDAAAQLDLVAELVRSDDRIAMVTIGGIAFADEGEPGVTRARARARETFERWLEAGVSPSRLATQVVLHERLEVPQEVVPVNRLTFAVFGDCDRVP